MHGFRLGWVTHATAWRELDVWIGVLGKLAILSFVRKDLHNWMDVWFDSKSLSAFFMTFAFMFGYLLWCYVTVLQVSGFYSWISLMHGFWGIKCGFFKSSRGIQTWEQRCWISGKWRIWCVCVCMHVFRSPVMWVSLLQGRRGGDSNIFFFLNKAIMFIRAN